MSSSFKGTRYQPSTSPNCKPIITSYYSSGLTSGHLGYYLCLLTVLHRCPLDHVRWPERIFGWYGTFPYGLQQRLAYQPRTLMTSKFTVGPRFYSHTTGTNLPPQISCDIVKPAFVTRPQLQSASKCLPIPRQPHF